MNEIVGISISFDDPGSELRKAAWTSEFKRVSSLFSIKTHKLNFTFLHVFTNIMSSTYIILKGTDTSDTSIPTGIQYQWPIYDQIMWTLIPRSILYQALLRFLYYVTYSYSNSNLAMTLCSAHC